MIRKTFLITFLISFSIFLVSAQGDKPDITVNSVLKYVVSTNAGDIKLDLTIEAVDDEAIKMKWSSPQIDNGRFLMKTEALQKGNHLFWGQPEAGKETTLEENQTVACFSANFYNELMEKGKAKYDFVVFTKKDPPKDKGYKLNGKEVDNVYIESEDGKVKVWLLKDENVPLILKMEGNASGVDLLLESVE